MPIGEKVSMFYGAKPHIFKKAKLLRKNMTDAELLLWEQLKGKKVLGLRFRAQHPMGIYITDFYCHPLKLVIEVDGGIHFSKEQREYDIERTEDLIFLGIEVIRFTNDEIKNSMQKVIEIINRKCISRQSEIRESPL